MCQSIADGGRRCSFHLEKGASSAVTSFASSVTGLSTQETQAAYDDLMREGGSQPDPSREEVDQFLEQQAFRARHDPDLTESRRQSIVRRLQDAIGRITPSGATFHAWRNLVAESWSRVRRKAAAAFLVGAVTFSVGACGTAPASSQSDDSRAEHTASAPKTPGAAQFNTEFKQVKPTISPEATAKFGQDAKTGTDFVVKQIVEKDSFNDDLARGGNASKDDVVAASDKMLPDAKRDWNKAITTYDQEVEAGMVSEKATGSVYIYTFYNMPQAMKGTGASVASDGPVFVNRKTSKVRSTVQDNRLAVTVAASSDVRVEGGAQEGLWPMKKETTYYMAKDADGNWKIDGWYGSYTPGEFPIAVASK